MNPSTELCDGRISARHSVGVLPLRHRACIRWPGWRGGGILAAEAQLNVNAATLLMGSDRWTVFSEAEVQSESPSDTSAANLGQELRKRPEAEQSD
jgi:hypothetical protein